MSLIQIVFGVVIQSDFMCQRCQGGGGEPGGGDRCQMCGGAGVFQPAPCYTYAAPDPPPPLWSVVRLPASDYRGEQDGTVVAHGSDYRGPVKEILP